MTTLPKPFDHPVAIGNVDCLLRVKVDSYARGGGDGWNEPRYEPEVDFSLESIRRDTGEADTDPPRPIGNAAERFLVDLLKDELRQACLDAIDAVNEPDPDLLREDRDERARLIAEDGGWGDE